MHAQVQKRPGEQNYSRQLLKKAVFILKYNPKLYPVRNAQGILFLPQVLAVCISVQLKNAFRFTNVQTAQKVYYSLNRMLLHSAICS